MDSLRFKGTYCCMLHRSDLIIHKLSKFAYSIITQMTIRIPRPKLNKKSYFTIVWIWNGRIRWRVVRIDMRGLLLLLLPHAVTKYGAHADITRRKMRRYTMHLHSKNKHIRRPRDHPHPPILLPLGNIYARLTFDMLIRALIGPLIYRVTRCFFFFFTTLRIFMTQTISLTLYYLTK